MQAHVAQSVEHFLGKEEVTGSNPVAGSTNQDIRSLRFDKSRDHQLKNKSLENFMAKTKKVTTHLACEVCKSRNYTQVVNKKRKAGTLLLRKFCNNRACRIHRLHKETK